MEAKSEEYKGHRIELRSRQDEALLAREGEGSGEPELLIDDEPIRYGQLPDGSYALHDYAYDWTDDLIELAKRFVDYRAKVAEIRREAQSI